MNQQLNKNAEEQLTLSNQHSSRASTEDLHVDWEIVRRNFPLTEKIAYLNSAAAGPLPLSVQSAATEFYRQMTQDGDKYWDAWLAKREVIRKTLAAYINAEPDDVAFTTNTSSGMNIIVDALEGRGEVISSELEFPVSTIPWLHRGIPVNLLKSSHGELSVADILAATSDESGIISISHVQYSNGFRADLEEIGKYKGSLALVVNASQSAGAFKIDVKRMRIDALCATGHKWMLSGYGSGFVYISRPLRDSTRPRAIGWLSVDDPYADDNTGITTRPDMAARVELGCPHFAGIFALGAAVESMTAIGGDVIERRVLELNRYLTSQLTAHGWDVLSPLQNDRSRSAETLVATNSPKIVTAYLAERDIEVTAKPEGIRVSTHFFNNRTDIDRLVEALNKTRAIA